MEDFKKEPNIKCIEQMLENLDVIQGEAREEVNPSLAAYVSLAVKYLKKALDVVKGK